jgi:hypothetical protein
MVQSFKSPFRRRKPFGGAGAVPVPVLTLVEDGLEEAIPFYTFSSTAAGTLRWDFHSVNSPSPAAAGGDIGTGTQSISSGTTVFEIDLSPYNGETGYLHFRVINGGGESNILVSQLITVPTGANLLLAATGTKFQLSGGTTAVSANNDPVGYWLDSIGSKTFIQATAGMRPLYQTASPSIKWDGSDDRLAYTGSLSDVVGSLIIAFKTGATLFSGGTDQVLFSSADTGTANNWFEAGIDGQGFMYVSSNAGGTIHRVIGSSPLTESTAYIFYLTHDGTDYYMRVGDTEQNPLTVESVGTFAWFGDVSGADNLVVGGTITSAGLVRPFLGEIMQIEHYPTDIT